MDTRGKTEKSVRRRAFHLLVLIILFLCFTAGHALPDAKQAAAWQFLGPYGGRVSAIIADPRNRSIFYLLSESNSVSKCGFRQLVEMGRRECAPRSGSPADIGSVRVE